MFKQNTKHLITNLLILGVAIFSYGQTGSEDDPFTSIEQVYTANLPGDFHFKIAGHEFSTFVDDSGYILVANDFGNGRDDIPYQKTVDRLKRGILAPEVLQVLTPISTIRITTSDRGIDVQSSNPVIINRLNANLPLNRGADDNIYNESWTGRNSRLLTNNASCIRYEGKTLAQKVFHGCGNTQMFHWIPFKGIQREEWRYGESPAPTQFQLWITGINTPLPIELLEFNGKRVGKTNVIHWSTASEINNELFILHRSTDAENWEQIDQVPGAVYSSVILSYESVDHQPLAGINYYKLEQIDFDGTNTFSNPIAVESQLSDPFSVQAFPNPCNEELHISYSEIEGNSVRIFNAFGIEITESLPILQQDSRSVIFNTSQLSSGYYYLQTSSTTKVIVKL